MRTRVSAACCGLMFAYGCFLGASQAVIGSVAADLGMDIAGMGALVSLQFLPALFVPVVMGAVSDRVGRKPVLAVFCAMFGIGLAVCGSAKHAWSYGLGALLVGAGYSVCESGCCAALSDFGEEWGARGINLSQALLCVGAVLSPVLVRLFGIQWRAAFFSCAACYAILLPVLLSLRFPAPLVSEKADHGSARSLLSSAAFLCLFIGILLYVGLETGFGYFIETLISNRFGSTVVSCVSLYWLGMTLSRFVFSVVRYRSKPLLIAGFTLSAALCVALTASHLTALSLTLCFATGFVFGPIWSTLVAEATARHPEHAGTASGLMSAGCGIGGIVFPLLTGLSARWFSLNTAFALLSGVALAGTLLCVILPEHR